MQFKIKFGEKSVEISAEAETTVFTLKTIAEQSFEIPVSNQKWIYNGKILADNSMMKDTGVIAGNTVLIVRSANPTKDSVSPQAHQNSGNVLPSSPQSIRDSETIASPYVPQFPMVRVNTIEFDRAIKILLRNPEELAKTAVFTLTKIVSNIVDNPLQEKYRCLKGSNVTFQKKIISIKGGVETMKSLGFNLIGDEWILQATPEAWDLILQCKIKLESFCSRLKQFDNMKVANSSPVVNSPAMTEEINIVPATPSTPSTVASLPVDPQEMEVLMQEMIKAFTSMQQNDTKESDKK